MKNYFPFLLIFMLTQAVIGQDFRPGYIITEEHDSVFGQIVYREGSQRFAICEFSAHSAAGLKRYEPGQIKGYGFTGGWFYKSTWLEPEDIGKRLVFAEVLLVGELSLLRYEH